MLLDLSSASIENYKSQSQKTRIFTEEWVSKYIFCPYCGANLISCQNNDKVRDFDCSKCNENYELKSKRGKSLGRKITDGAYDAMVTRISSNNNPNFYFLNYDVVSFDVINFCAVPKYFFIPEIIEKRKPLSENAKRAGWIGCNIFIEQIPNSGKIFYVKDKQIQSKDKIMEEWGKMNFLQFSKNIQAKGWLLDIMSCVDKVKKPNFSLADIYKFETYLKDRHPDNNNIQAKIRQQLQILRDKDYLRFEGRGLYSLQ